MPSVVTGNQPYKLLSTVVGPVLQLLHIDYTCIVFVLVTFRTFEYIPIKYEFE